MDFSKLNIEFSNMQKIICNHNIQINEIKQKIKFNQKEISKNDIRIKNTKNNIEKYIYKILIEQIKNENLFLQKLLDVEIDKVEESNTK